jgi:hypothetical protein
MDRKEKEGPVASAGMTISFKTGSRHVNINEVTTSQDDDFVGAPTKNTLNKLALMGLCPVFFVPGTLPRQAGAGWRTGGTRPNMGFV